MGIEYLDVKAAIVLFKKFWVYYLLHRAYRNDRNGTFLRNNSATVSAIKKLCDGLDITIDEFFHSELFSGLEQEIK